MADDKKTEKPTKLIIQTPPEKLHENSIKRPEQPQPQPKKDK